MPLPFFFLLHNFNSRPCVRGDRSPALIESAMALFQFTPLREGRRRHFGRSWAGNHANFNSRPCVRGDEHPGREKAHWRYFNSRPCVRGDRGRAHPDQGAGGHFNSRPCVRGDGMNVHPGYIILYFNSRPCVRGDANLRLSL